MAKKKIWKSKAEREAWEAHVDETIRRARELFEKAWAEIERKRAEQERASGSTS